MKYLVTGGAGFIGSHFILHLLENEANCSVVNFDAITYCGDLSRLRSLEGDDRYTFVQGDLTDKDAVDQALKDIDVVFNFAAETHVDRSLIDPQKFFDTNTIGTHNLLQSSIKYSVKKFVHVSTDEVYGSRKEGFFSEKSELNPTNPYSVSKVAAEYLVLNAYRNEGLPVVISRGSNTYGPYQYPEKVIPFFVSRLLNGEKLPLYGDGSNQRDWLYVLDHADAVYFLSKNGKIGNVYNVAGNHHLSNLDLTKKILNIMNKDESMIEYVKDRTGHDWRYALDDSKIRDLGWCAKFGFDDVFEGVIQWYQSHQDWIQDIRLKNREYQEYIKAQYANRNK